MMPVMLRLGVHTLKCVLFAGVVEWYTRLTQNQVALWPCGFESHHRHQEYVSGFVYCFLYPGLRKCMSNNSKASKRRVERIGLLGIVKAKNRPQSIAVGKPPYGGSFLYMGCGAAWGGHLSGRQDSRSVRIRYGPPFAG